MLLVSMSLIEDKFCLVVESAGTQRTVKRKDNVEEGECVTRRRTDLYATYVYYYIAVYIYT